MDSVSFEHLVLGQRSAIVSERELLFSSILRLHLLQKTSVPL